MHPDFPLFVPAPTYRSRILASPRTLKLSLSVFLMDVFYSHGVFECGQRRAHLPRLAPVGDSSLCKQQPSTSVVAEQGEPVYCRSPCDRVTRTLCYPYWSSEYDVNGMLVLWHFRWRYEGQYHEVYVETRCVERLYRNLSMGIRRSSSGPKF